MKEMVTIPKEEFERLLQSTMEGGSKLIRLQVKVEELEYMVATNDINMTGDLRRSFLIGTVFGIVASFIVAVISKGVV